MASERQISANRANAQKSTGPRSRAGKKRAGTNARSHGLNVQLPVDPEMQAAIAQEVDTLTKGRKAGEEHAYVIIETQRELQRIRQAKRMLLERRLSLLGASGPGQAEPTTRAVLLSLDGLVRLERYEVRAARRRDRAVMAYLAAQLGHTRMSR